MAFEIFAYRNRTTDWSGVLYQVDGTTPVILAASDVVRCKVGRRNLATPSLDIDSVAATANGSVAAFTAGATGAYTLRIAQADIVSMLPGPYDMEILLVDDSETNPSDAIKAADVGVLHIIGSMAGDIALT